MKFSDIPRFLIEDFISIIDAEAGDNYLRGQTTGIVTNRWSVFNMTIFDIDENGNTAGFYVIPFTKYNYGNNSEWFYFERVTSSETASTSGFAIDYGDKAYFMKNSEFYNYLESRQTDYEAGNYSHNVENFVNMEKVFLYFGEIHPTNSSNIYKVRYRGMDEYALSCLPEHNRTTRLKELFSVFFDKVYNEVYNQQKNVFTLFDPYEVNEHHLAYIDSTYKMTVDNELPEIIKRSLTANHINYLKRVGTYSSIFVNFKNIVFNTKNGVNIYERWHDKNITGPPLPHFIDYNYLYCYSVCPSSCSDPGYTNCSTVSIGGFAIPEDGCYIYMQYIPKSTWYIVHGLDTKNPIVQCYDINYNLLVPKSIKNDTLIYVDGDGDSHIYYKVILEFNTTCTGYVFIIKPEVYYISNDYNLLFYHNRNQEAPIIEIQKKILDSTKDVDLYSLEDRYVQTAIVPLSIAPSGSNTAIIECDTNAGNLYTVSTAVSGTYIHEQVDPTDTWSIDHSLNGLCAVNYYTPVNSLSWTIAHNLNTTDLIIQCYDNDYYLLRPKTTTIIDENIVKIDFEYKTKGRALLVVPPSAPEFFLNVNRYNYYGDVYQIIYADNDVVFCDCWLGHVLRSNDAGNTWESIFKASKGTNYVRISYMNNGVIFLGTWYEDEGVYISTDYGNTWNLTEDPLLLGDNSSSPSFTYLTDSIFLGLSGDNFLIKSTDGGTSWSIVDSVSEKLTNESPVYLGNGICIAAFEESSFKDRIWRSTDYGDTWTLTLPSSGTYFEVEEIAYLDNGHCIATIESPSNTYHYFKSTDYGVTWIDKGIMCSLNKKPRSYCNLGGGKVLAYQYNSPYYYIRESTDYGETWNALSQVDDLGKLSYGSGKVFAGSDYGTFGSVRISNDGGSTWTDNHLEGLKEKNLYFRNVMKGKDNQLLAICKSAVNKHIWKSDDNGITWNYFKSISGGYINPWYMYYVGNDHIIVVDVDYNMYLSTDYGDTWESLSPYFHTSYYYDFVNMGDGKILAFSYYYDPEVYRSTDYGETWVSSGTINGSSTCVERIIYLENGICILFSNDGDYNIMRSTDYGESWSGVLPFTGYISISSAIYCGNGIVLAVKYPSDIYKSTDYGESWSILYDPIGTGVIDDMISLGNGVIICGGEYYPAKIYRSTDYGESWTKTGDVDTRVNSIYKLCNLGNGVCISITGSESGELFYSTDYGKTWIKSTDFDDQFPEIGEWVGWSYPLYYDDLGEGMVVSNGKCIFIYYYLEDTYLCRVGIE